LTYEEMYRKWQKDVSKTGNPNHQVPTLIEYQRRLIRLMAELEAL